MSTTTTRTTAPHGGGSVDLRLARLLDTPSFARVVPHLLPETLHQLIQHRGLDACGGLVASATPAQLTALLDLDLWRHPSPGRDDQFDVGRFGEWVEVLVEAGDSEAARVVAALDVHLVVVGLSRYLRVFDPGTFEPTAQTDDEAIERHALMNSETSADVLECEVGAYLVRARRTDAWDAIVALLVALDIEQPHCFHDVMQGCRRLSNSRPEIDGLDELLLAPEQHLHDVAAGREGRRSRQGYATPAEARAFLRMARQPGHATTAVAANPIATAYFRAAGHDATGDAPVAAPAPAPVSDDIPAAIDALVDLLAEAGVGPHRPQALLPAAGEDSRAVALPILTRLMQRVRLSNDTAYLARTRELGFLANTLLAGCSVQSRPFTPAEASDAAASICNLGLECWPGPGPGATDAFLLDHDLVAAFEVGWSVLHQDVSLFVADALVSMLPAVPCHDADLRRGLVALRRALRQTREAGAPWLARDAADVLAMLDMTAWVGVLGLLDECPIMPAALTAVVERHTTSVSPTAFAFISTTAQIRDIRLFIRTLPDVLAR